MIYMKIYEVYKTMNADQLQRLASIIKQLKGNDNNRDFAKKIGISNHTISCWINMKTANPTTESLTVVANYMGITLQELMERIYEGEDQELDTAESFYSLVSGLSNKDKIKLIHFLSSQLMDDE